MRYERLPTAMAHPPIQRAAVHVGRMGDSAKIQTAWRNGRLVKVLVPLTM
jgi:hypothetical protein